MERSKLHIVLFFVAITLATSLKIAGTMSYYILNSDNFIERFCINTDKPELKCNGKCELAKMLKKENSTSDYPINTELIKSETVLFICSFVKLKFPTFRANEINEVIYSNKYSYRFLSAIEYPPEA
ncbi:hypothetical protein [Maribacter sp.]|uniref:hypothetical protein n=1 Tax=Maribacter sp. TaxID=1897614 RepID=UPI0025C70914|nr:hypothetical protein [Maribacter sp.]